MFRVYKSNDKREFTDYDICADCIEIDLIDEHMELYEDEKGDRLDHSRKVLGK